LGLFKNRVLRNVFGLDSEEVTGDWRKLHDEELHDLCYSPNIREIKPRRIRRVAHVACVEEKRKAYRVFTGKLVGKRLLGTPKT